MRKHHLRDGEGEGEEPDQRSKVIRHQVCRVLVKLTLAKFFLKLDFTRKGADGPRRRFRNLTKVCSSKESPAYLSTERREALLSSLRGKNMKQPFHLESVLSFCFPQGHIDLPDG